MLDITCDLDPLAQEQPPDPTVPTFHSDDGDRPSGVLNHVVLARTKGLYNQTCISQHY